MLLNWLHTQNIIVALQSHESILRAPYVVRVFHKSRMPLCATTTECYHNCLDLAANV